MAAASSSCSLSDSVGASSALLSKTGSARRRGERRGWSAGASGRRRFVCASCGRAGWGGGGERAEEVGRATQKWMKRESDACEQTRTQQENARACSKT